MNWITNKLTIIAVTLGFASLSFGAYYFYDKGKTAVQKEVTIRKQETYIETRKQIDASDSVDPSLGAAVERLRSRQKLRNK